MRKKWIALAVLCCLIFSSLGYSHPAWAQAAPAATAQTGAAQHEEITLELISILEQHPEIQVMLETSIAQAKAINPDPMTNPAQSLEEYYAYLDWAAKAMPWNVLPEAQYPTLFESIDQSMDYFYFLLDQPLEELEGRDYYYSSLQYVEELRPWLVKYAEQWGAYLSTAESWNEEYYQRALEEQRFNLDKGWYEDPSRWHTFNDFFSRRRSSPDARPLAASQDDAVVVAPADSTPQGVWEIDGDSRIVQVQGVSIKSSTLTDVRSLIGEDSEYAAAFAGGTLTHTFLNVDDYHRYHFPVGGVIREVRILPAQDAAGGITVWDAERQRYRLESEVPGWQSVETRGCVIVETPQYGLVALLPIGMSQVSSVNLIDSVQVGATVSKGDELGYFLFGGSDFVMIFQGSVAFDFQVPPDGEDGYQHLYMGETYGTLRLK